MRLRPNRPSGFSFFLFFFCFFFLRISLSRPLCWFVDRINFGGGVGGITVNHPPTTERGRIRTIPLPTLACKHPSTVIALAPPAQVPNSNVDEGGETAATAHGSPQLGNQSTTKNKKLLLLSSNPHTRKDPVSEGCSSPESPGCRG